MPSRPYAGQNRNSPVASGIAPNQPHQPTVPVAAKPIRTKPTMTRSARSTVPTLNFISVPCYFRGAQLLLSSRVGCRPCAKWFPACTTASLRFATKAVKASHQVLTKTGLPGTPRAKDNKIKKPAKSRTTCQDVMVRIFHSKANMVNCLANQLISQIKLECGMAERYRTP